MRVLKEFREHLMVATFGELPAGLVRAQHLKVQGRPLPSDRGSLQNGLKFFLENQGQNLAVTFSYVPHSLDSGSERGPCCLKVAPTVVQVENVVALAGSGGPEGRPSGRACGAPL